MESQRLDGLSWRKTESAAPLAYTDLTHPFPKLRTTWLPKSPLTGRHAGES